MKYVLEQDATNFEWITVLDGRAACKSSDFLSNTSMIFFPSIIHLIIQKYTESSFQIKLDPVTVTSRSWRSFRSVIGTQESKG
jgi:hypothetical protein